MFHDSVLPIKLVCETKPLLFPAYYSRLWQDSVGLKNSKGNYLACARFLGFFWFLQIFHKTIIHILKSLNEELFDIIFKLKLSIYLNLMFTVVFAWFSSLCPFLMGFIGFQQMPNHTLYLLISSSVLN